MKVLHVIPSLSRLRGGPTFVVNTLAEYQARTGVEVHVATTDDDDSGRQSVPLATPIWRGGAVYWYFKRNTRTYQSSIGLTSWLLRRAAGFDLIHIHSLFTYPATAAAAIAQRRSIPYVVRPLGVLNRWGLHSGRTWAKRLSIRLLENGILRRAAAVQFSSAAERDESTQVCPVRQSVVIPNPIQFFPAPRGRFRARHSAIGDRPVVLFVGRLHPVKGIELLLEAFRQAGRDAVLAIAGSGDGSYERRLRESARGLDVIWTGFLDKATKAEALADANVFVVPSQSESFGLAAVEAMAAGVPTVIADGVGIADEVALHGAGLVVPGVAPALADAIARILDENGLAAQLGARGRLFVETRYRPEVVASQTLQLYAEIGCRP